MNQNSYTSIYKQNSIETASREDILLMLYNGLVNFTKKAKNAMVEKDYAELHNNICKAQAILYEFINTLDYSINVEMANNLKSLYDYSIDLLTKANIRRDVTILDEAISLLSGLRDTWKIAVERAKKEKFKDISSAEEEEGDDYYISSSQDNDDDDDDDDDESSTSGVWEV